MPLHSTSGRWRIGLGLALVTMILWGILPLALAIILSVLDIYTITWFRFLIAFGLLAAFLASRRQLPPLKKLLPLSGLLGIAILGLAINYLLFLQGLKQTSPTNAEIIIQLAPVLMGLGALAIFRERYLLRQWLGLGILTLGMALFFHDQLEAVITNPSTYVWGNVLLGIAAATWAIYALAQKQLLEQLPSSSIMLVIYGSCMVLFTPLAQPQQIFELSSIHFLILIFCGVNTLIAYGAFSEALEHLEASRVSAILAATPLVTLTSVWLISIFLPRWLTPEKIETLGILGAIFVVIGAILIALGKKPSSQLLTKTNEEITAINPRD